MVLRKTPKSALVDRPVGQVVTAPIVASCWLHYKEGVNANHLMEAPDEAGSLREFAGLDLAEVLDFSGISETRKHFYVYALLFLMTLLIHTVKNFNDAGACPNELTPEVARLIEIGAVAKGLY